MPARPRKASAPDNVNPRIDVAAIPSLGFGLASTADDASSRARGRSVDASRLAIASPSSCTF